ncbi:MAG TPA: hypothetical protein VK771_06535, partial [Acidimicrobiia bacterium]|nr:hypothetical protein [Acidimicrobiia bacterium]
HDRDPNGEHVFLEAPFEVEMCDEPPANDDNSVAFVTWLQDTATAAVTRGEVLVVEPGGAAPGPERYALARAIRAEDSWVLNVEATPAITSSPRWLERNDDATGSAMDAVAGPHALADIGTLLFEAIATWTSSPLDVVLTFEPNPDGPWPQPNTTSAPGERITETNNNEPRTHPSALETVIGTWDDVVSQFLAGNAVLPDPLDKWFGAYRRKTEQSVGPDALPEPYLGRLDRSPAGVFLALNPGAALIGKDNEPDFQSRTGIFAQEIQRAGTFSAWAATWPYFGEAWTSRVGPSRHHRNRLAFLQHWHDDPALTPDAMVAFELYPWHTTGVASAIRPDPAIIRNLVWEPIYDLGNPPVFAFGAAWFDVLESLGLRELLRLGKGGIPYGSAVESRTVAVFRDRTGIEVVAEKHSGSATPPSADEVDRLRTALAEHGVIVSHSNP